MSNTTITDPGAPAPRKLRAGVVGLGWAGQQHMATYASHPDVDLVAIAGLETDARRHLSATYGLGAGGEFSDYRDLIASARLDIVSVCTPTALHAPIAVAALEAGAHVLSEKPMAENAASAAEMVSAAEANDRVLDVVFNHRRRGDVKALKAALDDGLLGEVYYAKASWMRRSGIPGLGTWFTKQAMAGGGPMMDIGIHVLDMALHLLREPTVETVTASTYAEFGPRGLGGSVNGEIGPPSVGTDAPFEVEDLATAFVRLGDGGTLLIETSWASHIEQDQLGVVLYGSRGGAVLGFSPDGWAELALTVTTDVQGHPAQVHPYVGPSGEHDEAIRSFIAKVQAPDWTAFRGRELLTRAAIVDAAYASAATRREVVLG